MDELREPLLQDQDDDLTERTSNNMRDVEEGKAVIVAV